MPASSPHPERTPVVAMISDILGGVDSWVWRLQAAFEGHPRYDFRVLICNRPGTRENALYASNLREVESRYEELTGAHGQPILLPNYVWPAFRMAARKGIARVVAFCHSDTETEYYNPLQWYEPICDRFVAVSAACARGLAECVPERVDDITQMSYGIQLGEARTKRSPGPLRLLYSGRLEQRQKRIRDLVPLVGALRARGVAFELSIVGDGPERPWLESQLGDAARFVGKLTYERMAATYREHDVLLLVSEFEGTSNSMLEAMAEGAIPVVTRIESGAAEVVRHGENGYLVEIGAMDAMADALKELAHDPSTLERLSSSAHATASQHTIQHNVDVLTSIFDNLGFPYRTWPKGRPIHPRVPVQEGVFVPRRLRGLRTFLRRRFDID